MKSILYSILALILVILAIACDSENTNLVGNSLADESVIIVVDSNFTVTGQTKENRVVQSRTLNQLIGTLSAKGYGSINSDFVGQFMPSLALDTADITPENIDSVKLFMQMVKGDFVGDSLVPMGVEVYRLTKDLPYPIYSDFNPAGYYDETSPIASSIYTASNLNNPDSANLATTVYTAMHLPLDLGKELFNSYLENPANFANPELFAKNVFKGVYIKNSYGSGRISNFASTSIRVYYHKVEWNEDSARYDTNKYNGDYFAVTPEVVVNNNIRYEVAPELKAMAQNSYVVAAPTGYELEMRFPAPEIIASYKRYKDQLSVVNTLTMKIPVEVIENEYDITPPPFLLMVLKKDRDSFFAKNQLTDNVSSFYAAYDATNKCYSFNIMRNYLLDLLSKDNLSADDYTFVLTPVQVNTESSASSSYYYASSAVESSIVPYVSKPVMAKILLDKAQIRLTFSVGNRNNL